MSASISHVRRIVILIAIFFNFALCDDFNYGMRSFTPSEVFQNVQTSCMTLFNVPSAAHYQRIVDELLIVYINDPNVQFGFSNFDSFVWPDGEKLRIRNQKQKTYVPKDNNILFFYQEKEDRNCLTESNYILYPIPELYLGSTSLNILVQFINEKCNTYRDVNGNLDVKGQHRGEILNSLFHVASTSDVSMGYLYERSTKHPFLGQYHTSHVDNDLPVSPNYCSFCSSKANSKQSQFCDSVCTGSDNKYSKENNIKPEIAQCDRIKLPLTEDEFKTKFLETSKPVIIENAAKNWPAFSKWSNEYFLSKYKNKDVHVKLTPGGDFEGVERAELWDNYHTFTIPKEVRSRLLYPDLVVVRPAGVNMNFSEFVDLISWAADQPERNVSAYLEYSSIPHYMPELEEDLEEFSFMRDLKRRHLNMWLSDGHTLGRLHFDPFDNLLCQLRGKKQVIMFEPHSNSMLYEAHIPQAMLSYDLKSRKFRRRKLEDSTSMVMSPVNILNPDFHRFPRFADAVPLNCTINEGDVLYMPAFWWHEVYSWPNATEKRNMAINYWYEPFLKKEFPCPECQMDVNPYYRDIL